jgi:hypothetical protein
MNNQLRSYARPGSTIRTRLIFARGFLIRGIDTHLQMSASAELSRIVTNCSDFQTVLCYHCLAR